MVELARSLLGRGTAAGRSPFIIATHDARALIALPHALAAVDAAAAARCDAIRLGVARQGTLPWPWCPHLIARALQRRIMLLARPDDEYAVARLDHLGANAFDIAFDMTDLDTIGAAAQTGKPIVLAVDSASDLELAEIIELVHACGGRGALALVVPLHDTSDLARLDRLRRLDREIAIGVAAARADAALAQAAVARGATIVEKRAAN